MKFTSHHSVMRCGLSLAVADFLVAPPMAIAAEAEDETTLHARFRLAAGETWASVTIELAPSAWRWGGAEGSPASQAQVQSVLLHLQSIEIGATCAGWADGPTSYPCGFAVEMVDAEPAFAARAMGWESSAVARDRHAGRSTPKLPRAGVIAPLPQAPSFVAVKVPAPVLAGGAARRITFRIRALSNSLVPSTFDRDSGEVILRARPAAAGAPA